MHTSFITLGVVIGSWIGGMGIDAYGLRAPLRVGAGLALLALAAMIPGDGSRFHTRAVQQEHVGG